MIVLSIKTESEDINIDFPENLYEVPLSRDIAFETCEEDLALWLSKIDDDNFYDSAYYLYLVARSVSAFLNYDLNALLNYPADSLIDEQGNLYPYVLSEHINYVKGEEYDFSQFKSVITTLYNNILTLKSRYQFNCLPNTNLEYSHKGKKFYVPHLISKAMGVHKFSKLTTLQAVEILQIKKALYEKINIKDRVLEDNATIRNAKYTATLHVLALLSIPEGKGPEYKLTDDLEDKISFLSDINSGTAKDVTFFLTFIMSPLAKTLDVYTTSTLPSTKGQVKKLKRKIAKYGRGQAT